MKEGAVDFDVNNNVFFNELQVLQRDISVAVLHCFANESSSPLHVLDAMAGCGIRAMRYAKEVDRVTYVVANDRQKQAVENMSQNLKRNSLEKQVKIVQKDANELLMENRNAFHVIDIDPCGSPHEYISPSISTIQLNGLLCLVDTDVKIAAELCLERYNATILSEKTTQYHKEFFLRLQLGQIERIAALHDRSIQPVLSLHLDFYTRLFVRVRKADARVKPKLALVLQCTSCDYFHLLAEEVFTSQVCPVCGESNCQLTGPIWTGELHDKTLLEKMETIPVVQTALDEISSVFYISLPRTFRMLQTHVTVPLEPIFKCLRLLGYSVSKTHCDAMSVKTNASFHVIYSIIAAFVGGRNRNLIDRTLNLDIDPSKWIDIGLSRSTSTLEATEKCIIDHKSEIQAGILPRIKTFNQTMVHVTNSDADGFSRAIERASSSGELILVSGGVFRGNWVFSTPVHIAGMNSTAMPTFEGLVDGKSTFQIRSSSVKLENIKIIGHGSGRAHAILVQGSECAIDNCILTSKRSTTLSIADGSTVDCTNLRLRFGGHVGIYLSGKSRAVLNCVFIERQKSAGIELNGGCRVELNQCVIRRCGRSGLFVKNFSHANVFRSEFSQNTQAGLEIGSNSAAKVSSSWFLRGGRGGILTHSSSSVEVQSSILHRNSMAGLDVRGQSIANLNQVHICNGRSSGIFLSDHGSLDQFNSCEIVGNRRAAIENNTTPFQLQHRTTK